MLVGNRPGSLVDVWSIRCQITELAGASALVEMKTRPVPVAAQSVPVSLGARSVTATAPPRRSAPYGAEVRSVALGGPILTKSPHAGSAPEVVNSGQFASRESRLPPQPWVRQALNEPWKIVPPLVGFGSAVNGG